MSGGEEEEESDGGEGGAPNPSPRPTRDPPPVPTQILLPGEGSGAGRGERRVTGRRLVAVVLLVHVAGLQVRTPAIRTLTQTFPGLRTVAPDSRDRIQGEAPHL